ncbi:MAG TPA: inorganic phosphate transporter [Opitutaceae bacterium]|jgi:PiT family inorganic phosphate transporter
MNLWGETLTGSSVLFLFLALALALSFEFVNGFHDTANAVATVIYTHTLRPWIAVIWSGMWNLIGVLYSSGTVAYGVIALLPVELVIHIGSGAGFAMVFSLLLSAIIWNLGTWYLGLPASSSHTLIGSIMGVGLANSMMTQGHAFGEGVNWAQAQKVGLSLLVSPIVGFCCAGLLLLIGKALIKQPKLFEPPAKDTPPPAGIRSLLVLTCTGVSFAHGSNDGQKGMGLIMLILIGIVPGAFALNMHTDAAVLHRLSTEASQVSVMLQHVGADATMTAEDATAQVSNFLTSAGVRTPRTTSALLVLNNFVANKLAGIDSYAVMPSSDRRSLRTNIYLVSSGLAKLGTGPIFAPESEQKALVAKYRGDLDATTKYIPVWVKVAVAFALGLGTMIGWKRIVVTVGEKIGKTHLSYAQGASAELVAMATILAADNYGLPVSTTHVLSSGVAGAMAANRSGLQAATLRNLLLAWVLTLPVCIFLGASLFAFGIFLIFHVFGAH